MHKSRAQHKVTTKKTTKTQKRTVHTRKTLNSRKPTVHAAASATTTPISSINKSFSPQRMKQHGPASFSSKMSLWTHNKQPLNSDEGGQNGKFGTQRIPQLFETDTPMFDKILKPIDFDGKAMENRPVHNLLTSQEFCELYGIVPVDGDVAHCVGTPDGPHPQEFIQINNAKPNIPSMCKYCGLKYIKSEYIGEVQKAFSQEQ